MSEQEFRVLMVEARGENPAEIAETFRQQMDRPVRLETGTTLPAALGAVRAGSADAVVVTNVGWAAPGLQSSHDLLRTTLDGLVPSIAIVDQHGRILATNMSWERGVGRMDLHPDDVGQGANFFRTADTATGADRQILVQMAAAARSVVEGETTRRTFDAAWQMGEVTRWFQIRVARAGWPDRPLAVIQMTGITNRRETEMALRRSEERYREILERAPQAVALADAERRITFVNRAACDLLGFPPEELLGQPTRWLVPAAGEEALDDLAERFRGAINASAVTPIRRNDGSVLTVEITAADLGNGEVQAVLRDITSLLSEEAAREASSNRYRTALDQATYGICFLDAEGRCTYVNATACRVLGRDRDAILDVRLRDLCVPADRSAVDASVEAAHRAGEAERTIQFAVPDRADGVVRLRLRTVALESGGCEAFLEEAA